MAKNTIEKLREFAAEAKEARFNLAKAEFMLNVYPKLVETIANNEELFVMRNLWSKASTEDWKAVLNAEDFHNFMVEVTKKGRLKLAIDLDEIRKGLK